MTKKINYPQSERENPEEILRIDERVSCGCVCHDWGCLSAAGRERALERSERAEISGRMLPMQPSTSLHRHIDHDAPSRWLVCRARRMQQWRGNDIRM